MSAIFSILIPAKRSRYFIVFPLFLSLLAGCAQQAPIATTTDWVTHEKSLENLSRYDAKGKLGYKAPKLRFGGNMIWQTTPNSDKLLLTNFLGKTLLKLDATPKMTTLVDYDGKQHSGADASELVRELTGINLPIEQMRDWLIGLPTAADTYQLNPQNRVAYLAKQVDGQTWEMDYQEYDYSIYPSLPKRMVLTQDKQQITLIINEWDIHKK
jgi:outer membrane lipoprotein LolB